MSELTLTFRPQPHQVIPRIPTAVNVILYGGRGCGKTWNECRWLLTQALTYPNTRWIAAAQTWAAAEEILALGEGGMKWHIEEHTDPDPAKAHPDISFVLAGGSWDKAFRSSPGRMMLQFANGSQIRFASADRPKSFRGKNSHGAAADEVAFWDPESFDMLRLAVRLPLPDGTPPVIVCGSTPDGENWFWERFLDDSDAPEYDERGKPTGRLVPKLPRPDVAFVGDPRTTRGGTLPPDPPPSTFDNSHTDAMWRGQVIGMYAGTDMGEQELYGRILSRKGAVFTQLNPRAHTREGMENSLPSDPWYDPEFRWPVTVDERGQERPDLSGVDDTLIVAGQDLGTAHDSAFIVAVKVGRRWCVVAEVVEPSPSEEDWAAAITTTKEYWQVAWISSESANPAFTNAQRKRGWAVRDVEKGPGFVEDSIRSLQRQLSAGELVVDARACPVLWRQLKSYRWKCDKDGKPVIPAQPVKENDDAVDALRYLSVGTETRRKRKLRVL